MKNNIKKRGLILGMISIFLLTACSKDGGGDTPPDNGGSSQQDIINFSKEFNSKLEEKIVVPEGIKNNTSDEAEEISNEIKLKGKIVLSITKVMSQIMEAGKESHSQTARGTTADWSNTKELIDSIFKGLSEVGEYKWEASGDVYRCKIYESGEKFGFITTINGVTGATGIMEKNFSFLEVMTYRSDVTLEYKLKIWLTKQYWKLEASNSYLKSIIQVKTDGSGYWEAYFDNNTLWEDQWTWGVDGHGVKKHRKSNGNIETDTF